MPACRAPTHPRVDNSFRSARSRDAIADTARLVSALPRHGRAKELIMTVKITPNDKGTPPGKLAEAEIHFEDGYFQGLKLVGFAVWERRSGNGRNVTFPGAAVLGQRRAAELRAAAADHRRDGAGSRARPDSAGVSRTRRADGGG